MGTAVIVQVTVAICLPLAVLAGAGANALGHTETNHYLPSAYDITFGGYPSPGPGACSVTLNHDTVAFVGGGSFDQYGLGGLTSSDDGTYYLADPAVYVHNIKTGKGYMVALSQDLAVTAAACQSLPPAHPTDRYKRVLLFGGAQGSFTVKDRVRSAPKFSVLDRMVVIDLNRPDDDFATIINHDSAAPWPPGRAFHSLTPAGSKLILFGGSTFMKANDLGKSMMSDLWELDAESLTWRELRRPPSARSGTDWPDARRGHVMVSVPSSHKNKRALLLFGGCRTEAARDSLRDGCWADEAGNNATLSDLWQYIPHPFHHWSRIPTNTTEVYDENGFYKEGGWPSPRAFMTAYTEVGGRDPNHPAGVMGLLGGNVEARLVEVNEVNTDVPFESMWFEFDFPRKIWTRRPQVSSNPSSGSTLKPQRFITGVSHSGVFHYFGGISYYNPNQIQAHHSRGALSLSSYKLDPMYFVAGNTITIGASGGSPPPVTIQSTIVSSGEHLFVYGGRVRGGILKPADIPFLQNSEGIWRAHPIHDAEPRANRPVPNTFSWQYLSLFDVGASEWPRYQSGYGPRGLVSASTKSTGNPVFWKSLPTIFQVDDASISVKPLFRPSRHTECLAPIPEHPGMRDLGGHEPIVMWTGDVGDRVFMYGGAPNCLHGELSNQLLAFDIRSNKWFNMTDEALRNTAPGDYPPAMVNARATAGPEGTTMYLFGGTTGNGAVSADLYALDVGGRTRFRRIPAKGDIPPALLDPSISLVQYRDLPERNWLALYGGVGPDGAPSSALYMFDIAQQSWSKLKLAGASRGRAGHAAVWHAAGEALYLYGGHGVEMVDGRMVETSHMGMAAVRPWPVKEHHSKDVHIII